MINKDFRRILGVFFALIILVSLTYMFSSYPKNTFLPDAEGKPQIKLNDYSNPLLNATAYLLVVVFFWGLGYTFTRNLRLEGDLFTAQLAYIVVGFSCFPIISLILSRSLPIPLDIRIYLVLSLMVPLHSLYRRLSENPSIASSINFSKESLYALAAVLLSCSVLFLLLHGSYVYPWIEDGDGWRHSAGVKYLAYMKTYKLPEGLPVSHTLEPYPPTYDGVLALYHQINPSCQFSMKFMTAFIASLGVVGFYLFAKKLTGNMDLALLGSFFLSISPSYPSHFLWAFSMGYVLFFPALYILEFVGSDRRWVLPAVLQTASLMVVQAIIAPVYGITFLLYFLVRSFKKRRFESQVFAVGAAGLLLSLLVYWVPVYLEYWGQGSGKMDGIDELYGEEGFAAFLRFGAEKRTYPVEDFFFAKPYGNIALHHTVGLVLMGLFVLSVVWALVSYRKTLLGTTYFIPLLLLIALFYFTALESWALPIYFYGGRFWYLITLPIAFFSAWGVLEAKRKLDKITLIIGDRKVRPLSLIFLSLVVVGVLWTSFYPRVQVQTSVWGTDFFNQVPGHLEGYIALLSLSPDTPVYPMCMKDDMVLGMDKLSRPWDRDILMFRGWSHPWMRFKEDYSGPHMLERTPEEIHLFLKSKGYSHTILCAECLTQCIHLEEDEKKCMQKYQSFANNLAAHPGFKIIYQGTDVIYQIQ
ncbi:MAG: hypothetical protein GF334_12885 [Candidatus Altiarchaeales archaeon]|nr:hypothetical protein [Candidatus Altiarchaeales archaeon]